ncbi:MAG: GmrSD restriction endonuclease domain-containing protein, partial [Leucothrix sp.]
DANTNILEVSVTADFVEAVSGDWRLACVITEDSVHGTDAQYGQVNYYSGSQSLIGLDGIDWMNLPSTVPASQMVYDHVARAIAPGFDGYKNKQKNFLRGSLGNLLPLSSSINSSLQNDSFPSKKDLKTDSDGNVIRNGYANGSYSELEVAACADWTAEEIKDRGLKLLCFMENRWDIKIKDDCKLDVLHLEFLNESE